MNSDSPFANQIPIDTRAGATVDEQRTIQSGDNLSVWSAAPLMDVTRNVVLHSDTIELGGNIQVTGTVPATFPAFIEVSMPSETLAGGPQPSDLQTETLAALAAADASFNHISSIIGQINQALATGSEPIGPGHNTSRAVHVDELGHLHIHIHLGCATTPVSRHQIESAHPDRQVLDQNVAAFEAVAAEARRFRNIFDGLQSGFGRAIGQHFANLLLPALDRLLEQMPHLVTLIHRFFS